MCYPILLNAFPASVHFSLLQELVNFLKSVHYLDCSHSLLILPLASNPKAPPIRTVAGSGITLRGLSRSITAECTMIMFATIHSREEQLIYHDTRVYRNVPVRDRTSRRPGDIVSAAGAF